MEPNWTNGQTNLKRSQQQFSPLFGRKEVQERRSSICKG